MSKYRLLKFDVVHPQDYLYRKHDEWKDLEELSRTDYLDRINRLRSNYSDYYTYHLDDEVWDAEEFYLNDPVYLKKVARELYGPAMYWPRRVEAALKEKIRPKGNRWTQKVIEDYIRAVDPDVLFARSQPLASSYWQQFRENCLLVARLSARMPKDWHPEHFDILYADHPTFRDFFELHDVTTYMNDQGFDDRVLDEVDDNGCPHDVTFVGGLGTRNFSRRTQLFERVAAQVPSFQWWGYWWPSWTDTKPTDEFPNLQRTFKGPTSGIEMFQIYRDSKIVLNDYVDIDVSSGVGFNQRIFEVLGVGAFMLTRNATNFKDETPGHLFGTFDDADDCLRKIDYYLSRPQERQQIADAGQDHVLEHFNYRDIVQDFDLTLRKHLEC